MAQMSADSSIPAAQIEPEYLATGVGTEGRIVRFQRATTCVEALAALEREGLHEVTLVFDDVIACSRALAAREAARLGTSPPPQDAAAVYRTRHDHLGPGQRFLVALDRRQVWLWGVLILAALYWGWRWWLVVPVAVVCALVLKVLAMGPKLMLTHEAIIVALRKNQGGLALELMTRWEKSLDLLGLRQSIGSLEIASLRARAMAAAGQRDAAYEHLGRSCAEVGAPDWLCSALSFPVFGQARDFEGARDALLHAIETGPPCATFRFDLALLHAMHLRDLPLARQYLEQARELPCSELMKLAMPLVEAAILVESGEPGAARERLATLASLPPLMALMMHDELAVLRCVVAGELGELAEARRQLRAVEGSLRARRDEYWLERCRRAALRRGG